jgi:hypothetical protein
VSLEANRRSALAFGAQASPTEGAQKRTSREFWDVIVNTLGRDHTLRHTYLRKRWQGLGLDLDDSGEGTGTGRPEPMAVRRRPKDEQQSV